MNERIKNMKLKSQMVTGFGTVITVIVILLIISFLSMDSIARKTTNLYEGPYQFASITDDLCKSLVAIERDLYKGIVISDVTAGDSLFQQVDAEEAAVIENTKIAEQYIDTEEEKALLAELNALLTEGAPIRIEISEKIRNNQDKEAFQQLYSEFAPIFEQASEAVQKLNDSARNDAAQYEATAKQNSLLSKILNLIVAGFGIMWAVYIAGRITKGIVLPVKEIETAIVEISHGNLDVTVNYRSNNEVGKLAHSTRTTATRLKKIISVSSMTLGSMAEKNMAVSIEEEFMGDFKPIKDSIDKIIIFLNDMIAKTRKASEQVTQASEQVAQVAQTLAANSTEQAVSVEALVESVDQVTSNVEENAEYALHVNEISEDAVQNIEEGNEYMRKLLSSMKEINQQSEQISSIIKVIDGIAGQTNLLSLNASIEAARAGEAGKGFAVVASEIGQLAAECAQAAKNTTSLIGASIGAVGRGSALADETAVILDKVVSSVKESGRLVSNISQASNQQARALEEILKGVNAISQSVEGNSATAEEASASSEELLSQAEELSLMLSIYKIKVV